MALELQNKQLQSILSTQQGKTYTVFGVTLFVVVVMFFLAIRPSWVSITNKLSENETKSEYIAQAEDKLSTLKTLGDSYERRRPDINYLNTYLPETPEESFVLYNLTRMAIYKNLRMSFVKVGKTDYVEDEKLAEVPNTDILSENKFTITLEGNIDALEEYVKELENLGRIFNIESISYSILETEDQTDLWQMTAQGYVYFWDIDSYKVDYNV